MEIWQRDVQGVPVGVSTLTDTDNDGLVELLEFAFGTNPNVNAAGELTVNEAGGTFTNGTPVAHVAFSPLAVKARFIRHVDYAGAGISYTAQFSNDLVTWQDLAGSSAVRISGTSQAGDYEAVELDYPLFSADGKKNRFFRIRVNDTGSENTQPQ